MKNKITFVFALMITLFSAVAVKAIYVQVINRTKLIAYSDSQVIRTKKIYPKRGQILDRNRNPLAVNVKRYNLFTFSKNVNLTISSLKKIRVPKIVNSFDRIEKNLLKRKGKFTWISRSIKLSKKEFEYVKTLDGIVVEEQFGRMYPNNEMASQLIGFVGIDNTGLSGIENYFNDDLKGKAQVRKYYRDAKGRPVKFDDDIQVNQAKDIVLSIDIDIQNNLERFLKEGVLKHEALRGGAGVMDANTGEVLAIANYPTYDPNNISRSKAKDRKLSFVTDPFEPGSVFKTLTISSALDHNVVRPDTNYFCERGKYRVQNHFIKESDSGHNFEWLSVEEILKKSSNIGTTKIAFDLTYPVLKKDLKKFHIGEKLNLEINGESRGILEQKDKISPLRLSNISFGQGVATTGIQMLASYAPFVNGGYYVMPTFLKKNKQENEGKRILKEETVSEIQKMLVAAVEDGTGANAKVKYFKIAGKTSTAQRIDETGKYNGYTSGFIGFPVGVDKKFVAFVYVEDPKKGYYGSKVAAPIFKKIVSSILYKKKEYNRLARDSKNSRASMDKISYKSSAINKIVKGIMPDLTDLDKSSTFQILDKMKVSYQAKGFGVVYKQKPAAGDKISKNTKVDIEFKAPDYE
jgi:cell division protein FtsI (penicillin-binding protein 3)